MNLYGDLPSTSGSKQQEEPLLAPGGEGFLWLCGESMRSAELIVSACKGWARPQKAKMTPRTLVASSAAPAAVQAAAATQAVSSFPSSEAESSSTNSAAGKVRERNASCSSQERTIAWSGDALSNDI